MKTLLKDQRKWRIVKRDGEYVVLGKRGQVAQFDDGYLDVWITNLRISNKAGLIWKAKSTYDDGACYVRPFADLDLACHFIKAKKRRQVTDAMRQRGVELAARMRSGNKKDLQGFVLTNDLPASDTQLPPSGEKAIYE